MQPSMRILDYVREPRTVLELSRRRTKISPEVEDRAREILRAVETEGDEAVTTYTRQLDCKFIDSLGLRISERECRAAFASVSREFHGALRVARANITAYHRKQRPKSWILRSAGVRLQHRVAPLRRVGIYVPGGKAAYPSTVLMNALPAKVAGVREIVMTTPCNGEGKVAPEVLVAAVECGISEIYRIGGVQAIGALAFGTESIRRVDKITGPGNAYVAAAKQLVYGRVGIDGIAGPTEVMIIADATARPAFVAADLIAQAEHDESASPILITNSQVLADQVASELSLQLEKAPRRVVAQRAFQNNGVIILVREIRQAIEIANEFAPEHLQIITRNPGSLAARISNAGAVFLGEWSTEALGDYLAGPNHTLPTGGTARFSSALSVNDFMKFTNVIHFSRTAFLDAAPHVEAFAEAERLAGHAASVRIRREYR